MKRLLAFAWVFVGLTFTGCNKQPENKGVNITAPGVNITVDKGGSVDVPGVKVQVK